MKVGDLVEELCPGTHQLRYELDDGRVGVIVQKHEEDSGRHEGEQVFWVQWQGCRDWDIQPIWNLKRLA